MKPNIFLLTIDSLRYDKIYGKRKSATTPNLDLLIKNGIYFSNNITSSDQTGTSLASIFTGKYPINSGITQFNFNFEFETFFDELKKLGYELNCCVTDLSIFKKITSKFDTNLEYVYAGKNSYPHLDDGLGTKIIQNLSNQMDSEPWIFYCHLMDLKNPQVNLENFDDEKFGKTPYDRNLSILDIWVGKILKVIDSRNTIVVITADHGEYVKPSEDSLENSVRNISKIGKKFGVLESIGKKPFSASLKIVKKMKQGQIKKLTPFEKRNYFLQRSGNELYDDLFKVPLIFSGFKIDEPKVITEQVRHIDVFPTVFEIAELPNVENPIDGRSNWNLYTKNENNENDAYIESGSNNPKEDGKTVGIRTNKWKYFRSRENKNKNAKLFNLEDDPDEENGILNEEIVKDMEEKILKISEKSKSFEKNQISDEEAVDMEKELRKMGYID